MRLEGKPLKACGVCVRASHTSGRKRAAATPHYSSLGVTRSKAARSYARASRIVYQALATTVEVRNGHT